MVFDAYAKESSFEPVHLLGLGREAKQPAKFHPDMLHGWTAFGAHTPNGIIKKNDVVSWNVSSRVQIATCKLFVRAVMSDGGTQFFALVSQHPHVEGTTWNAGRGRDVAVPLPGMKACTYFVHLDQITVLF